MALKYDDNGLIPAIIQDDDTGEILMFVLDERRSP